MTHANTRGNTRRRRNRKLWLLSPESGFGGDGVTVPCSTCPTILTYETLTVDRYPVMGIDGGTYQRGNIRPTRAPCNCGHGARVGRQRMEFRRQVAQRRAQKRNARRRKQIRKRRRTVAA
ncbi:MAG: hypothetical protein CK431_04515 [Mycobacterium sp.]|nr:MAG: hypothetical protein CK431_04515 [Mycobacterium sp.]